VRRNFEDHQTMPQHFHLHQGSVPLLISIPHLGTALPPELHARLSPEAATLVDTDWHLDRLYAFARELGASVLAAHWSRYVIDLNRPPGGESLYPGQATTGLCPSETFTGAPLYRAGCEPTADEHALRLANYWQPYHQALRSELDRLRTEHGHVLLWEAHSIASAVPRLFEGKLPDLNFGTNEGRSCSPGVIDAVLAALRADQPADLTHVVNGRFKGGYITRHYGQPEQGVDAIQLEMCQSLYMNEAEPFDYRPDLAERIQPVLQRMLTAGLQRLPQS
jgi:N-formylglutamate deformylase